MHQTSRHSIGGGHRRSDMVGSSRIGQAPRNDRFVQNSRLQPQSRSSLRKAHEIMPQKRQQLSFGRRSPPLRRSSPHLRRSSPVVRRSSPPIRRSPSPVNRGENKFGNRARIPSPEKTRPVASGYRREFWSSDYITDSARPDPVHNSLYPRPVHRVQRGPSPLARTSSHDVPVRRMSSDARFDAVRRGGVRMKTRSAMPGRNGPKMHPNYDDLLEGRGGSGDGYPDETFHGRSQPSGRPFEYEDKAMQPGRFRDARPVMQGRYESRRDGYRGGTSKADWGTTYGRNFSPEQRDEEDSRMSRKYAQHVGRERNYKECEERGHDASHRIEPDARNRFVPLDRMLQADDRPAIRPHRTSTHSPINPERHPAPPEKKPIRAAEPSGAKKGYGQDLRPEEILVTRKYQSMYDAKDNLSKGLPEERRVKIVRELSTGVASARSAASYAEAPKSQRSARDTESDSSPDIALKRSMMDMHGDTDDRILNKSVRSQIEVRQLRSSSHDFGDKDDRHDQASPSDLDSLDFDSSDEISLTKKPRSESRDDERPRERFDRKVNTRDPDDLRNSLARRRKNMKTDTKERSSVTPNGLRNRKPSVATSKDSVKRRSSDAFPVKQQDRRDHSPKRRRLSESHHLRPAVSTFKQPAVPPRRDFSGFHSSSYAFRGRRFPSFAVSRGRGMARDFAARRPRPFASRGFAARR